MFKILTTTGGRPDAWELCKRWMEAQVLKPDAWIIVDDCPEPSDLSGITIPVMLVRPQPYWKPGQNTQARNLLAGLEHVNRDDQLAIIEDDDWYSPEYLRSVMQWLRRGDLVGEAYSLYYHVGNRQYKDCGNRQHASLCSTAMRGPAIMNFKRQCERRQKFIDLNLWRESRSPKFLAHSRLTVGIKGLPGRAGIGMGHRLIGKYDEGGALLQRITGTNVYDKFYNPCAVDPANRK